MQTGASLTYLFFIISAFFFFIGLLVHTGIFKGWWLIDSTPVTPVGIFYTLIPSGLLFLILGLLALLPLIPERRGDIAMYTLLPLMVVILILATWQPQWLKPPWLRWLETNHEQILRLLWEDARRRGRLKWQHQVRTQRGLEEWVAEVRSKYKLDDVDQRFIGDPHV